MATPKTLTLDEELKALLASATRNEKNEIIATPFALTYDEVVNNDQTIAAIVASAKPFGEVGANAEVDKVSAARECAQKLMLLVSKFDYAGKALGTGANPTPAVPAGTDWLRRDVKTKAAVESFYGEILPLVSVMKWQLATGNPVSEFPFRKSVEYFFGILRRQVLPTEMLKAYNLASDSPSGRVTANRAELGTAAKNAFKSLDGVKLYPKTFDGLREALDALAKITAQCETLAKNAKEAYEAAMAQPQAPTGTSN